jgi:hypothetical protein
MSWRFCTNAFTTQRNRRCQIEVFWLKAFAAHPPRGGENDLDLE